MKKGWGEIIPAASFNKLGVSLHASGSLLSPWIQCIWTATPGDILHLDEKLYPDAGASLTFEILPSSVNVYFFYNTQTLKPFWSPSAELVSVRFRPGGAPALLGLNLNDLQNQACSDEIFTAMLRSQLEQLRERLWRLPSLARCQAVEQWLKALLPLQKPSSNMAGSLIELVGHSALSPHDAAAQHGRSRRTLERKCRNLLGVSPAQLQSFSRIRQARHWLMQPQRPITDIALACGYYDQAHFTNVFHTSTFETPHAYRQRKLSQISNPA